MYVPFCQDEIIFDDTSYYQTYTTDYLGNILTTRDFRANAENLSGNTLETTYDYAGRVLTQTTPSGTVTNTYDASTGLLLSTKDAKGNVTSFSYDAMGRLGRETSDSSKTEYLYDIMSNLAQTRAYTTSNEYTVTKNVYDDRNRLEYFITIPNSSEQSIVKYTYDPSGKILSVSEGLASMSDTPTDINHRITRYVYDIFGNLISETDSLGQTEEYTYDIHGNMISFTDRNGTEFVYEYDILGRLLSEDYASSEENQDSISYTYDFLGNTLSMIDNRGEILYSYDKIGNMISEASDGNIKTYTYDANGNNLSFKLDIEEDTKQQVSYTYDASNRVSLITEGNNTTSYTYDANGNILTETVKSGNIIKRNTTFEYDSSNRPIHKRVYIGSDYEDYTMTYNLMGNVTRVDTKIYDYDTRTSDTSYVIYTYDGANRLVKEEYSDGSSIEYTYDKFGNMSSKTTGDVTSTYEYDKNNRLTSYSQESQNTDTYNKIKYFYDNNGNMVSKIIDIVNTPENIKDNLYRIHQDDYSRVSLYEYDKRNRLSKATTDKGVATYTYRGDNFRDSKTVTTDDTTKTTDFIYNGMYIVYDTDGTASNTYSRGLTDLIFKTDNNNTKSYFITNQHGDVSALVSSDGTPISSYKYDAYGNIISDKDTNDTNPFSYCGEYLDFETGFIYLRNRYYDPDTARFITQDPIKDGLNWYGYCGGNPVMFVDRTGLDAIIITDINGADISGGSSGGMFVFGHTSALYQNEDGDWFYTYWGDEAAAVIRIPDSAMTSLYNFNNALPSIINSVNGKGVISSHYTHTTYVVGNFVESLHTAIKDVAEAANKSDGKYRIYDDGSIVYIGSNSPYFTFGDNCIDRTYKSLSKGTLVGGKNVGTYMKELGIDDVLIPRANIEAFSDAFMNSAFSFEGAKGFMKYRKKNMNSKQIEYYNSIMR